MLSIYRNTSKRIDKYETLLVVSGKKRELLLPVPVKKNWRVVYFDLPTI
jgi:hypothetical protein